MDTFVDSSWYFLRYCSPHRDDVPFDRAEVDRWMPGRPVRRRRDPRDPAPAVRAVLHQGAARHGACWAFTEPFERLLNQGMVVMDGSAMSKSRGNLVPLTDELERYGVDAVRLTMIFAGPPEEDVDWADVSAAGSMKFLARAWRLSGDVTSAPGVDVTRGDVALRRARRTLSTR
jgi:leucyl-tRNA synthetase